MAKTSGLDVKYFDHPSRYSQETLVEQLLWLIKLRWVACAGIVLAGLVTQYVFPYPVLLTTVPIYVCSGLLFLCNIFYYFIATKKSSDAGPKDTVLGIIQVETDLTILTIILYFSGGVVNPFVLFYLFHIIIATIILPKNLSYIVGLTTILLFGLLVVNELKGGIGLGYYPLQLSMGGGPLEKSCICARCFYGIFMYGDTCPVLNKKDYYSNDRQRGRSRSAQRSA